ncbi:YlbL family protein [Cumulibacter soli]|uniref:YlbL family protein n=1 Tax=Cumulibacter soli TaxID=2546344 RepID=UPI001067B3F9|nr:S16 family serine protease [Cumulibacter soli]
MTRRVQTLLTGVAVLIVLVLALAFIRLPYIALVPGPTVNTLGKYNDTPIIEIEGKTPNKTSGNLNLTTIGIVDEISIIQAISGWFSGDSAIVPREVYYPPTQTREETTEQNRQAFVQSESAAIVASMDYLGYPKMVVVVTPPEDSDIAAGDALQAIDGTPVATTDALSGALQKIEPGTTVTVDYLHNGAEQSTDIVTTEPPEDAGVDGSLLGATVTERGYGGFSVNFPENDIGGPSAGLMLTLGIIDLVGDEPLIDGEFIAGTGEISPDGKVGPIGGIRFKIIAATEAGAELFLTPAENCAEALDDPPDDAPPLAKVSTLQDAVDAIEAYRAGQDFPVCS